MIKVEGISGDKSVENQLLVPNFIKIDTDGMNFKIIKNFRNTLQRYRPIVQFDFSKRYTKKAKHSIVGNKKFLEQLGFKIKVIDYRG